MDSENIEASYFRLVYSGQVEEVYRCAPADFKENPVRIWDFFRVFLCLADWEAG
jgi:hypothetical protein